MILNCKSALIGSFLFAILMLAACSNQTDILPEQGPEVVARQFYEYISEAKIRGGASPAKEAFKLINSEAANLDVHRFLEIIKLYPPGFMAEVGKAEIDGTQAVVAITFKMPSSFGGSYDVKGAIPLNVDKDSNRWVIDFTGDTYGMQKADFMATMKIEASK